MTTATVDYELEYDVEDDVIDSAPETLPRRKQQGYWAEQALCAQTDPESFFPEKGGSTRDAKRVCISCVVRAECLEYAIAAEEHYGIWGGLSERERRPLGKNPLEAGLRLAQIRQESEDLRLRVAEQAAVAQQRARSAISGAIIATLPTPPSNRPKKVSKMKDEARFPATLEYLCAQPAMTLRVPPGDRASVSHDLLVAANAKGIQDVRRVLRKLGRSDLPVEVVEFGDGELLVSMWNSATEAVSAPMPKLAAGPVPDEVVEAPPPQVEVLPEVEPEAIRPRLHVVAQAADLPSKPPKLPKLTAQQRNAIRNFKGLLTAAKRSGNAAAATQWQSKIDQIYNAAAAEQASA